MSRVIVRSFVAWGENCEDPLIEAIHPAPHLGPTARGASGVVRTVAGLSFATGLTVVFTCIYVLFRAWWRGLSSSLLWCWLLVYALLQSAVLPSRATVAFWLPSNGCPFRHLAATIGEMMYAWLVLGVVVHLYGDPCVHFPGLRSAVGWIIAFSFVRSTAVDLYQLIARRRREARPPPPPPPAPHKAGLGPAREAGRLVKRRYCCPGADEDRSHTGGCAICLVDFEEGVKLIELPCRHAFHSRCITKWLKRSSKCPLCMCSVVVEEDQSEKSA